jgi:hypothetical protein
MPLRAPPSSSPSFAIVHKASKNRTNYGMYSSPQCAPRLLVFVQFVGIRFSQKGDTNMLKDVAPLPCA